MTCQGANGVRTARDVSHGTRSAVPSGVLRSTRMPTTAAEPVPLGRAWSETEPLIEALRRGERSAQAQFFDQYVDLVERILLRVMGPDSELEDLVQDSFMAALASIHRFRGNAAVLR